MLSADTQTEPTIVTLQNGPDGVILSGSFPLAENGCRV